MFKDWNFDDWMNHAMMLLTLLGLAILWFVV
jgi:hypothetical protein